jgi:hypothetical protein
MLRTPAIRTLFDEFLAAHLGVTALR